MSAPWGETELIEKAKLDLARADVNPPETEEQRRQRQAHEAQQRRWQRDLAAMYHVATETFEELARRAIPRASLKDMPAQPHVQMAFNELMAYRAGQLSIIEMIRTAAMKEAQGHG